MAFRRNPCNPFCAIDHQSTCTILLQLSNSYFRNTSMTNQQASMVVAIENAKRFLLTICPIDELPNEYVQSVVRTYRSNNISYYQAINEFIQIERELEAMVNVNVYLNNVIEGKEE